MTATVIPICRPRRDGTRRGPHVVREDEIRIAPGGRLYALCTVCGHPVDPYELEHALCGEPPPEPPPPPLTA